jgi:hypothetical protein
MLRKATVWKVKIVGKTEPMHVMTPGASFYDMGDISGLLKEAASEFGVSREAEIESIEKFCVALGTTRLPYEGALALREDGTIAVNDPERLAVMAGLDPNLSPLMEGSDETMRAQDAHDPELKKTKASHADIVDAVNRAPGILEALELNVKKQRSRGRR